MNNISQKMKWRTWPEAFRLFFNGTTLQTCIPVALVVGLIPSTINQSDVIVSGAATTVTWLKVGMNFVVPFFVSSYGFFNGCLSEDPLLTLKKELQS
jgi:hypothetical protein